VHKIFYGTKDINKVDKEAKDYTKSKEFEEMVKGLIAYFIEIQKETHELYNY
jgi:hypothetical protein